jgi:hypothetical protein
VLDPAFFAWGLELRAPDRSQVSASGSIDVLVGNPRGAFLLADFEPHAGGARTSCIGDAAGRAGVAPGEQKFTCTFAAPGTYDVSLYVNGERYGRYAFAGSVQVNTR